MRDSICLESVNIGRTETISYGAKSLASGIRKAPVQGLVTVDTHGLAGDTIVDSEHHGGADQAVYVYRADDYDWWTRETGQTYAPGLFGENLTVRGLPSDLNVGDRMLIREVVLEITAPRIPCSTLALRLEDSRFGETFRRAERPGVYCRVLSGGEIEAGDSVTFIANEPARVSILDLFRFNYELRHDASRLHRFLEAPLAIRFRRKVETKLCALDLTAKSDDFS